MMKTKPTPDGLIDPKSYYIGYADGKKAPQTKPLSDEEIFNLTTWKKNPYELYVEMEKEDIIAFARAIEERHGIK